MPTSKDGHFYYSWFPTIFAGATQHMSLAEDGAYRRLIDHYMVTKQPLPDIDSALARIAGVGRDEWDTVKAAVKSHFKPTGLSDGNQPGYLTHVFCDQELGLHQSRIGKAQNNGKKGGRPNIRKNKANNPPGLKSITQQKAEHNITEEEREYKGKPLHSLTRWQDFKSIYPKARAGSWQKAMAAYQSAIKRGFDEDQIYEGALAYANSEEVARGYAKGAAAWLNDDRFMNDYSNGGTNGNANAVARGNPGQHENPYLGQGFSRGKQRDDRDPATRARDEAQRIITERRERWAKEDADRVAAEGQPGSAGTADPVALPSLRQPANLRRQSGDDGIQRPDVSDRPGAISAE